MCLQIKMLSIWIYDWLLYCYFSVWIFFTLFMGNILNFIQCFCTTQNPYYIFRIYNCCAAKSMVLIYNSVPIQTQQLVVLVHSMPPFLMRCVSNWDKLVASLMAEWALPTVLQLARFKASANVHFPLPYTVCEKKVTQYELMRCNYYKNVCIFIMNIRFLDRLTSYIWRTSIHVWKCGSMSMLARWHSILK